MHVINQKVSVSSILIIGGGACSPESRPLELTGYSGRFASPNFPNDYDNSAICEWRIVSAVATGVSRLISVNLLRNRRFCFLRL